MWRYESGKGAKGHRHARVVGLIVGEKGRIHLGRVWAAVCSCMLRRCGEIGAAVQTLMIWLKGGVMQVWKVWIVPVVGRKLLLLLLLLLHIAVR